MCGIAGILYFDRGRYVDTPTLLAMRDTMRHRGPDGEGIYTAPSIGLAHRRLSILDLSASGKQPFSTPDGRYHIIFNGEIFNYQELRSSLESEGYQFRSKTDTEVLLYMFVKYGEAVLEKLNGMFAFAVWDNQTKNLFIARDRVGIKPLYYAVHDHTFYFASEPKAIFAAGVPFDLNEKAFTELLLFRYIAGEQTTFQHIRRLLPGHCMTVEGASVQVHRWWNLPEKIRANRERLPTNPYEWFSETFYSATQYRTISDVPIGLMLSGGLDSSSLAVALHDNGHKDLASFTVTFDDPKYNEGPLAKLVAEQFGFNYHEVALEGDQLLNTLGEASWLYDEPLVHQNDAQMLALAHHAKQFVTVLLSGEGGDELMGGYFRYKPLNHITWLKAASLFAQQISKLPSKDIVNRFEKLSRYLSDPRTNSLVLLNVSNIYPVDLAAYGISVDLEQFEYRNKVLREAQSLYPKEPARQAMYLDLFTHMSSLLDRNDRMTMGASIECRVPFLDYRLLEMIPALPSNLLLKGKKGKWLLFNSIGKRLPEEVRKFRKLGLSVPWEEYMRDNEVFLEFINHLGSDHVFELPVFEQFSGRKVKSLFQQQHPIGAIMVRHLFMLSVWQRTYLSKFKG
ncbi:MAG: Asparagine synthetase [glutamine-hydrolyzing] 1 [Haliscomenobacter sp.]|nr:Asparagine synthetase [glutamine-hydrolyzing] 1 [Haliscomenobacter sp.]